MLNILKNKKVLFFDVGYTLDYPASGDWMFTNKFYELTGSRLADVSASDIQAARRFAMRYLNDHHLVKDVEEECRQFFRYYSDFAKYLGLPLSDEEARAIAEDRAHNMDNYIVYPDSVEVVKELNRTHRLGIISDTWPSIEQQLKYIGVYPYFSGFTYSCDLGVFKPDERIYTDALEKSGCRAEEAVFIDDAVPNLEGAAKLGITPILIAANPASDVETKYCKIHSLTELLSEE